MQHEKRQPTKISGYPKNLIDQITYAEHAAIKKCASAIRKLGEQ